MRVTQALKWSFLSELAWRAVQPIVFIALARLLVPDDFGVVAAATMVIAFSKVFWDAGMAKAVIQYPGDRAAAANVAFWVNLALGTCVAAALVASADTIGLHVFHDQRVGPVLKVMSLQVLLAAAGSVHVAVLLRELKFRHLFYLQLSTVGIPGLISIPLAWHGEGYWALVLGSVMGQVAKLAILWRIADWKPALSFDRGIATRLVRFGIWVAGAGLLGWLYHWADALLVGHSFSANALGLYHTGGMIGQIVYNICFGPILPVLYSYLSKRQASGEFATAAVLLMQRTLLLVSLPVGLGLFVFGDSIAGLLGEKWVGAGPVIAILGLMHGLSWLMGANEEAYRAMGRPDIPTKILCAELLLYVPAYYVAAQYSLTAFLWARLGLTIVTMPVHFYALRHVMGLSYVRVLKNIAPVALIAIAYLPVYVWAAGLAKEGSLWRLLLAGLVALMSVLLLSAPLVIWTARQFAALRGQPTSEAFDGSAVEKQFSPS